jgi:hypothetical protein
LVLEINQEVMESIELALREINKSVELLKMKLNQGLTAG